MFALTGEADFLSEENRNTEMFFRFFSKRSIGGSTGLRQPQRRGASESSLAEV
jgi:hypothetical protein